jgi:hypothetical protein
VDPTLACIFVGWTILHLGALAAAWGTRVAAGSRWDVPLQLACFSAMAAVGAAAWILRQFEMSLWIPSGVTLVGMVLTAVVDTRGEQEAAPVVHASGRW